MNKELPRAGTRIISEDALQLFSMVVAKGVVIHEKLPESLYRVINGERRKYLQKENTRRNILTKILGYFSLIFFFFFDFVRRT